MKRLTDKEYIVKSGEVLVGSSLLKSKKLKPKDKLKYMLNNMEFNKVFIYKKTKSIIQNREILKKLKKSFKDYRQKWNEQPKKIINEKIPNSNFKNQKLNPLCVDIEVASICDLACPFCFREHEVTPDKIIDEKFCYSLIDQAAELNIPSIKFNWRGEPLLHPKLPKFINYAKKKGILETIINTNATNLNEKKSKELIEAGLDSIIYSFDGGSKKTYEKMRPGRFKKNKFDDVYNNIKNFKKIKEQMKTPFPYTKIQMILTKETMNEIDNFFNLFENYVDDVSLSQYTERGGDLEALNELELKKYNEKIIEQKLPKGTPYLKDVFGNIKISKGRKPCEQPFQRLMVSYEGKVAMCCYDWGAKHTIGYTNSKSFNNKKDYTTVFEKAKNREKGFELLDRIVMPKEFNKPKQKLETIKDIWFGKEINKVRTDHLECNGINTEICRNCTFKDVYKWE
tara:strand:+ start:5847 stop:7208 length:1362 start_codon:yes stop_codon:yes gene_type:complete